MSSSILLLTRSNPSRLSHSPVSTYCLARMAPYHRIPSRSDEHAADMRPSADKFHRDLILSVLQAQPSVRDSRPYLKAFAPPLFTPNVSKPKRASASKPPSSHSEPSNVSQADLITDVRPIGLSDSYLAAFPTSEFMPTTATVTTSDQFSLDLAKRADAAVSTATRPVSVVDSILSATHQHTGLVKIQGPFTDRQLTSIVDGIIYLKTLGLVPIIVVDDEAWQANQHHYSSPGQPGSLRAQIAYHTTRLSDMIEARGCATRPMLADVFRLGDGRGLDGNGPEVWLDSVTTLRSAIEHREIPVLSPVALNSSCAAVCISADDAVKALAVGLTSDQLAGQPGGPSHVRGHSVDLRPLRLMIINREGGIPSPARNGHPHLSINLASEYEFINQTFRWTSTHPTALASLKLAQACLTHLPNEASALVVSHRSPKSLIANLITNKPAHSPSLRHATLLNSHHDVGPATPTLIRKGLPIRVLRHFESVDQEKMTELLEASFRQQLGAEAFYERLSRTMKFVIIAGDYQGAAVVTDEWVNGSACEGEEPVAYLDKFAVLPSLQGEGTVDFLWGALRDESFGLGCSDALNNNGGLAGHGRAVDLVWRSRATNPVNKWYWERSNGHLKLGPIGPLGDLKTPFSMFWCLANHGQSQMMTRRTVKEIEGGPSETEDRQQTPSSVSSLRLQDWATAVSRIPGCWV